MMMSEFTERTGYEPTYEEYHMIEESYYEFDGNKDEFCKEWLKDYKDGHWKKELTLRQRIAQMQDDHQKEIAEREDNLKFYRPYFDRAYKAENALKAAQEKLDRLERVFKRTFEIA